MRRGRNRRNGCTARIVLVALLAAWSPAAWLQETSNSQRAEEVVVTTAGPEHALTQYAHTAWRVQEGFFTAPPLAIGQTRDGQLWVGGEGGLLRFDGVQFVRWKPPPGTRLRSQRIYSLLGASDGSLWIGTGSGLARWKDGKLTVYAGAGVFGALLEDRRGAIWAGHFQALDRLPPLCRFSVGKFDCFKVPNQIGEPYVSALQEDREGNVWIGGFGLCRWADAQTDCHTIPLPANDSERYIRSMKSDSGGSLWVDAGSAGIWKFKANHWERDAEILALPLQSSVAPGRLDDTLWMSGVGQGLIRRANGKTDRFTRYDGLSGDPVQWVFEDREGSLWVATSGGLDRFRDVKVATLTPREGLAIEESASIAASHDGSVWISGEVKLVHLHDGRFDSYDALRTFGSESVDAVLEDSRGRLWIGAGGRLIVRDNGRFRATDLLPPKARRFSRVYILAKDADGTIWAATTHPAAAVVHVRDDRVLESFARDQIEKRGAQVTAMAVDPAGGMWLGVLDPGGSHLMLYRNGQFEIHADSLGKRIRALLIDARGVWAATDQGLALYRNDKVAVLDSSRGLPCDDIFDAIKEAAGALWLMAPCGLVRITDAELSAWAQDPTRRVEVRVLDALDGVRAGLSSFSPRAARSVDGRLWFAGNYAGVQVLDPSRLASNPVVPSVAITRVVADRSAYQLGTMLRLPPLTRDIELGYTAYSLAIPERVRFRYRLEGADGVWVDAGYRREALLSKLGPGRYRFEVLGSNDDGVWSDRPASLEFEIAAAFYQTWWFRILIAVALAGALWAAYRWRLHRLAREFNRTLDTRVGERTRIARELHDTLLQSFQGLLLRFQAAYELLPARPDQARQSLGSAIDRAEEAITEGRDAVQGLRASSVEGNDLALAIRTFGEELASEPDGDGVAFSVVVEGPSRTVHPILRDEIYRIASEALRNAFRHARASEIEVELRYDQRQLRLRVRDDGKGMDAGFLSGEGREGHYGLRGMRERAMLIGGKLNVWSGMDSGTEVELLIPAPLAYAASSSRPRSWLAERFSIKSTSIES